MRCAVEGCGEDSYSLVLFIGRFGAKQPHAGIWSGIWLCKKHQDELGEKLKEMGVLLEKMKLSGLTPIPDEVKGLVEQVMEKPEQGGEKVEG